ncbi:SUMO-conjugating enzyme Ubc9 [Kipferlia bialata]|uniref:SUMO-conjugating enzyme Ubc9 n=1 Tax=Kipferlia bialata TaxID=797122 RepID=A0A391NU85_9EUKA|nr:SUMO-conjugating enzyme Ubc9 [Kipferlia bialata]|eukprot:g1938.t1
MSMAKKRSNPLCMQRLEQEWRSWKKTPLPHFFARPAPDPKDKKKKVITHWICGVPGVKGTHWEGCMLKVNLFFVPSYPEYPPKVQFDPPLFHPNVYPSGSVCLSLLNKEADWKPSVTVPEILKGLQMLLNEPNEKSPAQTEAYQIYIRNRTEYVRRIKAVVDANPASEFKDRIKRMVRSGKFVTDARSHTQSLSGVVGLVDLEDLDPAQAPAQPRARRPARD